MSVNKFKVGDVVKCVDVSSIKNLTLGKEYIVTYSHIGDDLLYLYNDNGDEACYSSCRFELCDSANAKQPHKFKVGDVVKCVDAGAYNNLTIGNDYVLLDVSNDGAVKVEDDEGNCFYYYSYRFELSNGGSANAQQPPKFKEGDMVYLIGFDCLKPHKLISRGDDYFTMKFKVEVAKGVFETFTEDGKCLTGNATPSLVIATEENRQMLNKLLGVEYKPSKLTGSDLAKKWLKDKPQTCYVSDNSDDYAKSSGGVVLIMEYENDRFISKSGTGWKFAVPCDRHGDVLEDE